MATWICPSSTRTSSLPMSIASWFGPSIQTISVRCVGRTRPAPRRAATRANSASLARSMKTVWKTSPSRIAARSAGRRPARRSSATKREYSRSTLSAMARSSARTIRKKQLGRKRSADLEGESP
jgi:hypothetical protein